MLNNAMLFDGFQSYVVRLLDLFENRVKNLFFDPRVNIKLCLEAREKFFARLNRALCRRFELLENTPYFLVVFFKNIKHVHVSSPMFDVLALTVVLTYANSYYQIRVARRV